MILAALPDHRFLPAPLWLLTVLHLVTLTLHLLAMNALLGSVVFALFAPIPDRARHPVTLRLVKLMPSLMAATVTLGVAPLLFVQLVYGRVIYAASIASGFWWILVPAAAMVVYGLLYAVSFRGLARPGSRALLLLALAGLVFVSLVYSSVFALAERPADIASVHAAAPSGTAWNPDVGAWLPRWAHAILGALMVGFLFVRWMDAGESVARRAAVRMYLGAFVLAFLTGIAYLFALTDHLKPFMRSSGIWWLTGGVVLSLGAAHLVFKGKMALAGTITGVSVLGMVAARHELRRLVLGGAFDPAAPPVEPQWGVFSIFLLSFVAAIALSAWMLRAFRMGPVER